MYTPEYILKFVRRVDHVHNFSSWAALSVQHAAFSSQQYREFVAFRNYLKFLNAARSFYIPESRSPEYILGLQIFFFCVRRSVYRDFVTKVCTTFRIFICNVESCKKCTARSMFLGHPKFSGVAFVLCFVGRAYAMTWCHPVILHTWYVHTPGIFFMFVKFCLLCFRSYDYCVKLLFVPGTWYTISYHMSSWRTNATSTTYIWYVLYVPRKYIPVPIVHMETNNISIRYPTLVPAGKGVDRRKWMTPLVRTCNRNRSCGDRWILFFGGRSARMISQVFYARPFFIPGIYIPGI